jgi:hypothetical protein
MAVSLLGVDKIFFKGKLVYCAIEDFWDTVKYEEERINGELQRNVYRIENYPICSCFRRIPFANLRKGDHFIIVYSKSDYSGPGTGYGKILSASSEVYNSDNLVGIEINEISMKQCWTEQNFEKHMILSGCDYHGPSGHFKNGVRVS